MSVDRESPTWAAVKAFAENQIEDARNDLELPHTSNEFAQLKRGRIAALRELLKLADPAPVIVGDLPTY